ncbi:uncharacterized protein PAC_12318 [Phialocephala subalpina]|uniref:Uncharacterized protein n=1 Tax=Phialocephala subalpina TaxID=576137 RepID=A0A1L7XBM1_9HELO|nr:uncharacterized protein PAC_12318 [Phialocephala subalpina]
MEEDKLSRSKLNHVMEVYKEAREVGMRMQLDYHTNVEDARPQYMNMDIDTIWIRDDDELHASVEFSYGLYNRQVFEEYDLDIGCYIICVSNGSPYTLGCEEIQFRMLQVSCSHLKNLADLDSCKIEVPTKDPWRMVPGIFEQIHRGGGEMRNLYFHWDAACDFLEAKFYHMKQTRLTYTKSEKLREGMSIAEIEHDDSYYIYPAYILAFKTANVIGAVSLGTIGVAPGSEYWWPIELHKIDSGF